MRPSRDARLCAQSIMDIRDEPGDSPYQGTKARRGDVVYLRKGALPLRKSTRAKEAVRKKERKRPERVETDLCSTKRMIRVLLAVEWKRE